MPKQIIMWTKMVLCKQLTENRMVLHGKSKFAHLQITIKKKKKVRAASIVAMQTETTSSSTREN